MPKDYYKTLGVARDADDDAIKKSYRKLAMKHHPDKVKSTSESERKRSEEKFKDAAEAYEVLSDASKRASYDAGGMEGPGRASAGGMPPGFASGGGFGPGGGGFTKSGGVPVHVSFGTGGGGMDSARAEDIFRSFFGGEDPFAQHGYPATGQRARGGGRAGGMPGGMGISQAMGGMGMGQAMGGMGGGIGDVAGISELLRRARAEEGADPGPSPPVTRSRRRCTPDVLPRGATVEFKDLKVAELNGTRGRVERFDGARGRYVVSLQQRESTLAFRPSNLRQVVAGARIAGTSQAQLNGREAAAAIFDETSNRYRVEGVSSGGGVIALKPENVVLPYDTRVTLRGVQSQPALNGKRGRIVEVDQKQMRYVVELEPDRRVSVRVGAAVAS